MKKTARSRAPRPLYVTYCSGRKREDRAPMPSIRRYISARIRAVHRKSREDGAPFAILSGEFGLLGPYRKIPYYDHLLRPEEVAALLPLIVGYLVRKRVRAVRFFHDPIGKDPRLAPYIDAVTRACRLAGARLVMTEL